MLNSKQKIAVLKARKVSHEFTNDNVIGKRKDLIAQAEHLNQQSFLQS